jgi:hypothetical protein
MIFFFGTLWTVTVMLRFGRRLEYTASLMINNLSAAVRPRRWSRDAIAYQQKTKFPSWPAYDLPSSVECDSTRYLAGARTARRHARTPCCFATTGPACAAVAGAVRKVLMRYGPRPQFREMAGLSQIVAFRNSCACWGTCTGGHVRQMPVLRYS